VLGAQIAFAVNRGRDAPPLLLEAARRLEPLDIALARETYLDALWAALMFAGPRVSGGGVLQEVATAAKAAPPAQGEPRAADLLLDALGVLFTKGLVAAAPLLTRAVSAFRGEDVSRHDGVRWL